MADQSTLWWGLSVDVWDSWGLKLMIFGASLGVLALLSSLGSSFVLYKTGNIFQAQVGTAQTELKNETLRLSKEADDARTALKATELLVAEAKEKAEAERIERLKLEALIAPRSLSQEHQREIANSLLQFSGLRVRVVSYVHDMEGALLAKQIAASFGLAGFVVLEQISTVGQTGQVGTGVAVEGVNKPLIAALVNALGSIGQLDVGESSGFIPGVAPGHQSAFPGAPIAAHIMIAAKPIKTK